MFYVQHSLCYIMKYFLIRLRQIWAGEMEILKKINYYVWMENMIGVYWGFKNRIGESKCKCFPTSYKLPM